MANNKLSPFNEIPPRTWKKFKQCETRYNKLDTQIVDIKINGHKMELKQIFKTIIECDSLNSRDRRLAENIWERYDITGEILAQDIVLVEDWYCDVISSQFTDIKSTALDANGSLENKFTVEHDD